MSGVTSTTATQPPLVTPIDGAIAGGVTAGIAGVGTGSMVLGGKMLGVPATPAKAWRVGWKSALITGIVAFEAGLLHNGLSKKDGLGPAIVTGGTAGLVAGLTAPALLSIAKSSTKHLKWQNFVMMGLGAAVLGGFAGAGFLQGGAPAPKSGTTGGRDQC